MTSHVSTAVAAIVASLQGAPAVAPQVDRVRLRPIQAGASTAVVVRPQQTEAFDPSAFNGAPQVWQAVIAVECYARATPGQSPDVAVDALTTAVYARLMADPTLGGAINLLQPLGVAYEFDADGEQTACAVFTFSARTILSPSVF